MIGRVDILLEVSLLTQYQASSREGHMEQRILHIFAFLKKHPKLLLHMSPELPRIDYGDFRTNREDFFRDLLRCRRVITTSTAHSKRAEHQHAAFVNALHAANKVTRRSHYVVFINRAPVVWYSKLQHNLETSTFSAEFIALKVCLEAIEHLRFKLRCFGVPLPRGEPTNVFCDNESVVKNMMHVKSTLNKKHSSVAYHHCRWSVAAGVITMAQISTTQDNIADCFTKRLLIGTRNHLFGSWTY